MWGLEGSAHSVWFGLILPTLSFPPLGCFLLRKGGNWCVSVIRVAGTQFALYSIVNWTGGVCCDVPVSCVWEMDFPSLFFFAALWWSHVKAHQHGAGSSKTAILYFKHITHLGIYDTHAKQTSQWTLLSGLFSKPHWFSSTLFPFLSLHKCMYIKSTIMFKLPCTSQTGSFLSSLPGEVWPVLANTGHGDVRPHSGHSAGHSGAGHLLCQNICSVQGTCCLQWSGMRSRLYWSVKILTVFILHSLDLKSLVLWFSITKSH